MDRGPQFIESLSAEEFASQFSPSEFGDTWNDVIQSKDFNTRSKDKLSHEDLTKSIAAEGITTPVRVSQGRVLDGHHRVAAAIAAEVNIPYTKADSKLIDLLSLSSYDLNRLGTNNEH